MKSITSYRRWLPFVAWASFVVCAAVWATTKTLPPFFLWLTQQPGGDKVIHVVLIGGAAFLLDYALHWRRIRSVPVAAMIACIVMTIDEFAQIWMPNRSFDWADLAANYVGIGLAWAAAYRCCQRSPAAVCQ